MKARLVFHVILLLVIIAVFTQITTAREAYVTINITYFSNYNPLNLTTDLTPDVTNRIFVGNNSEPSGTGSLTLPLTSSQSVIIDVPGSDDVPGLYVQRGHDPQSGNYVEFSSYAFNYQESWESIKFDALLTNAIIVKIENDLVGPYDGVGNLICGIDETDPSKNTGDDEFSFHVNATNASFCSMVNIHFDRARIYYVTDDITPPVINNIIVTPSLPLTLEEGEGESLKINFISSEYPINVHFQLLNSHNSIIHTTAPVSITKPELLPATYNVPDSLHEEIYRLIMIVEDQFKNEQTFGLGSIIVEEERDSGGENRNVGFQGSMFLQPAPKTDLAGENKAGPIVLEYTSSTSKEISWLLVSLVFLIINLGVFALIFILLLIKR